MSKKKQKAVNSADLKVSTASSTDCTTACADTTAEDVAVYRHPKLRRLLAAAVDYIAIQSVFLSIMSWLHVPFGFQFWMSLFVMTTYYTVGNSTVTAGQTLGKILFRLHVLDAKAVGEGNLGFLSLKAAFIRYFVLFGFLQLLTEGSNKVFRTLALVTSYEVLKTPVLLNYCYSLAALAAFLLGKYGLGVHDWCVGSRVERKSLAIGEAPKIRLEKRFFAGLAIGVVAGVFLWLSRVAVDDAVVRFETRQFAIESQFNVRVQWSLLRDERIFVKTLVLSEEYGSHANLAVLLTQFAREFGAVGDGKVKEIVWHLESFGARRSVEHGLGDPISAEKALSDKSKFIAVTVETGASREMSEESYLQLLQIDQQSPFFK